MSEILLCEYCSRPLACCAANWRDGLGGLYCSLACLVESGARAQVRIAEPDDTEPDIELPPAGNY